MSLNFSNAFDENGYNLATDGEKVIVKTTVKLPKDYWDSSPITEEQFNEYEEFETERTKGLIKTIPLAMKEVDGDVSKFNLTIQQPGEKIMTVTVSKDVDIRNPGTGEVSVGNTTRIISKVHKGKYRDTIKEMYDLFDE